MDLKSSSRWADEIDEDEFVPTTTVEVKEKKQPLGVPKEDERIVTEIKTDPDTGKKVKVYRTFRLEKQLGKNHYYVFNGFYILNIDLFLFFSQ